MAFKAPAPTPSGLWRRVPPAVFPSIMGLFGLGLAWRRGAEVFALPTGIGELILGGVTLLYLFSLAAYIGKILRRPGVVTEDLRILPGRAGLGTMVLCIYLLSITLAPYTASFALTVLLVGFAAHAVLVCLLIYVFVTGPAEQRRVTPVWHLNFVGFIIGALAAASLELYLIALPIYIVTAIFAAFIWAISLEKVVKEDVPAPLRPLLMIHLAPVALLGLVADALDLQAVAMGAAGVAAFLVLWLLMRVRWLTEAGFSPFWGSFTFPLAATASLWLATGGIWRVPGGVALVAATMIVPAIAFQILRLWSRGQLSVKTNAAIA